MTMRQSASLACPGEVQRGNSTMKSKLAMNRSRDVPAYRPEFLPLGRGAGVAMRNRFEQVCLGAELPSPQRAGATCKPEALLSIPREHGLAAVAVQRDELSMPQPEIAPDEGFTLAGVREYLTSHYDPLSRQLACRVGCGDLAREALHDVWLRLTSEMAAGRQDACIERPGAYLARMAYHAAIDRLRHEEQARGVALADEDYLDYLEDPAAGVEQIVAGRNALRVLADSIDALPRRRQAIFLAIRLEALSQSEVARRFGLSLAVVRGELHKAHAHCAQALHWGGFGA